MADFRGAVFHSSDYRDGAAYRGLKASVFGTGSGGPIIAQDLHDDGADVTLVQRGSMTVCSIEPSAAEVLDALFSERAADEVGMIAASVPYADKVMATGFEAQSAVIRQLFGDAVPARIGPVWGMDDKGEQRNVWRCTSQKGFWFMFGNFQQCRFYSTVLALQICANLRELMN